MLHLMMARHSLSTLLVGLVTVLSGTVLALGPGLHALPGCGHHAIASQAARGDDGLRVVSGEDTASACPICEYLAHGKVVAERVHVVVPDSSPHAASPLPSIPPDLNPRRAYGCRAPPSAHTV
jgi:hypothetical protein